MTDEMVAGLAAGFGIAIGLGFWAGFAFGVHEANRRWLNAVYQLGEH